MTVCNILVSVTVFDKHKGKLKYCEKNGSLFLFMNDSWHIYSVIFSSTHRFCNLFTNLKTVSDRCTCIIMYIDRCIFSVFLGVLSVSFSQRRNINDTN